MKIRKCKGFSGTAEVYSGRVFGASMRIIIRSERCDKCGVCVSYCPEAFKIDRKGNVSVNYWELPVGLEQECGQAAQLCPQDAIEIIYLS